MLFFYILYRLKQRDQSMWGVPVLRPTAILPRRHEPPPPPSSESPQGFPRASPPSAPAGPRRSSRPA